MRKRKKMVVWIDYIDGDRSSCDTHQVIMEVGKRKFEIGPACSTHRRAYRMKQSLIAAMKHR